MSENNKTDFAELKEKLTKFDVMALSAEYIECCKRRQYNGLVRIEDMVKWQHSKDSAIISELIEIIQLQSEALEYYKDGNGIDADFDENNGMVYYLEKTKDGLLEGFGFRSRKSLSETTTRLQKLRDGIESGK